VRKTHREREDLEGRLSGGGWRLEKAGTEELPCELVREWHFLGSGVLVKQVRSRRKEMGIKRERERERESVMG
jgi:hypothetical protein